MRIMQGYKAVLYGINGVRPVFELAVRGYLAWVFFASGLTKLQSWQTTLLLFEHEYAVPLLSPTMAAWLGTAVELILPVLIAIGLGSRLAAMVLFVFNAVAVISYPDLSDAGYQQHLLWGFMMMTLFFYGPGKWSLDGVMGGDWRKN
jgi:putative oxidoreductase